MDVGLISGWGVSPGPAERIFCLFGAKASFSFLPSFVGEVLRIRGSEWYRQRSQIGRHGPMYERHPSRRSQSIASNTHQMAVIFSSQADPVNVKAYSFSNAAMGAWSCATLDVPGASSDELLMSKKLLLVISIPSAQG